MSSLNTNVSAMAAIRSLSMISNDLGKTQARIESGLRINQASNDPAMFSIAQGMRADLKGLDAVKDSLTFGGAALRVQQAAATKISDELGALKEVVTKAQQQGLDKDTMNAQIRDMLSNIDGFTKSATFNGVNLLIDPNENAANGVTDNIISVTTDIRGNNLTVQGLASSSNDLGLSGLTWDQAGLEIAFDENMAFANGDVVTLRREDGSRVVFEFVDGGTALSTNPVEDDPATAGDNEAVNVVAIVYDSANESPTVGLQKLMDAITAEGFGVSLGTSSETGTEGFTAITVSGALNVGDSVTETNIAAGATAQQKTSGTAAIAAVDAAITAMGENLAALGNSIRQMDSLTEYNKLLTDSVKEGLGALVDADLAAESAKLTALQTRQQLSVQSLSIANQGSQSLIGLFR